MEKGDEGGGKKNVDIGDVGYGSWISVYYLLPIDTNNKFYNLGFLVPVDSFAFIREIFIDFQSSVIFFEGRVWGYQAGNRERGKGMDVGYRGRYKSYA